MNKLTQTVIFTLSLGAALTAAAQPALKVVTVDMLRLYTSHYQFAENQAKLQDAQQKAQQGFELMLKDGNALVEQYNELVEQAKNPALTNDARTKAEGDAKLKKDEIDRKQADFQNYQSFAQNSLQKLARTQHDALVDEINKIAVNIAKKKGATLVIDKSGLSNIGAPVLIYADTAYDITDEVVDEINKDRPAPPAATSNATAPATEPKITVPGITPPKTN